MSAKSPERQRKTPTDKRAYPAEEALPDPDGDQAWRRPDPEGSAGWRETYRLNHVSTDAHEEVTSS